MSSTKNIHLTVDDNGVKLSVCSRLAKEYMQKRANEELDNKINTKEREENNMDIVELYFERKRKELKDAYRDEEERLMNENVIVQAYNKLVEEFKQAVDTLLVNVDEEVIKKTGYGFESGYAISNDFRQTIRDTLQLDFEKEMKEINETEKEVNALLELSDELEYRLDVLTKYEIIDKKSGKVNK